MNLCSTRHARQTLFRRFFLPFLCLAALGIGVVYANAPDQDEDGIPDAIETWLGLDATVNDAAEDPDYDGLTNLEEYLAGTDPLHPDTDRDGWDDASDDVPVSRAIFPWGEPRLTLDQELFYLWPTWVLGAFREGGAWSTNEPWGWIAETSEDSLVIALDSAWLSNDLWMAVSASNAVLGDLTASIYGTNLIALTPPIALAPALPPWLTNRLPLASHPSATFIAIHATQGIGRVTLSMLYVDSDGDGLDDDQAAQLAANASTTSVPATVTVSGVVSYNGTQPGFVHVVAVTNADSWTSPWHTTLVNPGAFALAAMPVSATYWIRAYVDANDNTSNDCWEARGDGLPSPLHLVCATNVTVTLTDPDSNNDGLSDWGAMQLGLTPAISNACARFPFVELFETNTVHLGDIHGQHGWVASVANTAWVQSNRVYAGQQALALDATGSTATVYQVFAADAAPIVWTDLRMIAELGCPGATNTTDAACGFFFDENGRLCVLDGLQPAGRKWATLTNHPPVSAGEWVRISVCLDFGEQRWLICLNGSKVAENLGFGIPCDQLHLLSMQGERGVMDNLSVSTNQPANLSLDNDALPDAWELQHFGDLAQTGSADPDADGLSNLQEYQLGTDPTNPDTDADTLPDGWEVAHGLNPLSAADAALDADTDGLSNLAEYEAGTDPRNPASHCWAISGRVDYEGAQTGAIRVVVCSSPTGWPSIAQTMIATTGSYAVAEVPPNSNYWVKAWRDSDGNGTNDLWEAWGAYTNHSITLFTNVVGVNIELADPDSDGDGMPDWWELSHSLNPADPADAASDPDGDGLSNLAEYRYGTNPHQADTDGDGAGDGSEIQGGSNPAVSNAFARLPFLERFETNTTHAGDVNGQNGWMTTASNTILVQTGLVWEGEQALAIQSSEEPAGVRQLFSVTNAPVVWVDSHVVAWAAQAPTNLTASSAALFFNAQGYPMAYDGLIAGSNKWMALTNLPPLAMTGEWVRLTFKLDYGNQRWLVCVNGVLAGEGLGFAAPVSHFSMIALEGQRGGMDALSVSTNQPPCLSLDGDALPDAWELQHFGDLAQTGSADPDADGLSNLQEYQLGTDPTNPDTDADGLPDAWEISHGLDPLSAADAALDTDADGLSNLSEYANNTNPFLADTDGDTLSDGYEVNTLHTDPLLADTDGDDLPDGLEVAVGSDPTVANDDLDGDGLSNFDELQRFGTDPTLADSNADGTPDLYLAANPTATDARDTTGSWQTEGTSLIGNTAAGMRIGWAPALPLPGAHFFSLAVSNAASVASSFSLALAVDDALVASNTILIAAHEAVVWEAQTPWLPAGTNSFRLIWIENAPAGQRLAVSSLRLQAIDAPQTNGVQVWHAAEALPTDSDTDTLADRNEITLHGTGPTRLDSDGDLLRDGDELAIFGLNPALADSDGNGIPDATLAASRSGVETAARLVPHITTDFSESGDLLVWPNAIDPTCSYDLQVTTPGIHVLELDVRNYQYDPPANTLFEFRASLLNREIGTLRCAGDIDRPGTARVLTPWLPVGVHRFTIAWKNRVVQGARISRPALEQIRLIAVNAPDADGDGIQDWMKMRLFASTADSDGDGLLDRDEVLVHGTNPLNVDTDGDGLSDKAEITAGTNPLNPDTDGDGIDDYSEIHGTGTNPLMAEFTGGWSRVLTLPGSASVLHEGPWHTDGAECVARGRGWVEYLCETATPDLHLLRVTATHGWWDVSCTPSTPLDTSDILVSVNGVFINRAKLRASVGVDGEICVLLPYLPAGMHRVRLLWNTIDHRQQLRIRDLALETPGGADADGDGVRDWIATASARTNRVLRAPATSPLSPACIEGSARWPAFVSARSDTNVVAVLPAASGRWYADLPLDLAGAATPLALAFENGACTAAVTVVWAPLALTAPQSTPLAARLNDTLRVAVTNAATVTLTTNEIPAAVFALDANGIAEFPLDTPGLWRFATVWLDAQGAPQTNLVQTKVYTAPLPAENPACMLGRARSWSCPGVTPGVILESGPNLTLAWNGTTATLTAQRIYTEHTLAARAGSGGPIITSRRIDPFWIQAAIDSFIKVVEIRPTSQVWENRMVSLAVPPSVQVELHIFVGGVTFDDLTIRRWLPGAGIPTAGDYRFRLIHPNSVTTSTCHTIKAYQNGVLLGEAYYALIGLPEELR